MKRTRFKSTRVFIRIYPRDKRIKSITIQPTIQNSRIYIVVFGKRVYITKYEAALLGTSVTIHYE